MDPPAEPTTKEAPKELAPGVPALTPEIIGTPNQGYLKRDSQIKREEDEGKIEFIVVKNDKKLSSMRNLIDLKNIIAKQLPRMPRNYIVRLTMDRQHEAMIIRKRAS
mmetsp:Transcript_31668/g.48448  ORF Transcript_31668/g.48448 Transcript_31668/m.48448 type:complete len:107 (+) Transcript_31668:2-322(+)